MKRITYTWNQRITLLDGTRVDEFLYFGSDGDTTPPTRVSLSVENETDEQQRERVRAAIGGSTPIHWW